MGTAGLGDAPGDCVGGGDMSDAATEMTECGNCGEQRYTYERCHHCGNVHWEDD